MDFYYEVTDMIKKTESKGQDLLIDSFIIGCMVGRGMVKELKEIQKVVNHLHDIKQQIENNQISPFARDEFFIQQLSPLTLSILPLNNEDEKAKGKKKTGKKKLNASSKTNQQMIDDQSQFEQKGIVQESQMQEKETKNEQPKQEQPKQEQPKQEQPKQEQSQYEQKPEATQSVQTRKRQTKDIQKNENKNK